MLRVLCAVLECFVVFWFGPARAATPAWKPEKAVEFIVPASPGGGQDRIFRSVQKIIQDSGAVGTPMSMVNKAGGGGNFAYAYLTQFPGDPHYLAIATATFVTNHLLGVSTLGYNDFTPLCILSGEYIGFAVNADGPIKSGRDLLARLRKSPESVSFAFGTSRGNSNHIAASKIMRAAGGDLSKLKVVIYKSSIDATTALMGGHVDVVVTPTSTFVPVLATGKIRIIAIAAPQRVPDRFSNVPTWKEEGANVNVSSFRMLLGAKGLAPAHVAYWDSVLARVAKSEAWKKEVDDNEWDNIYLPSAETRKYLDAQQAQYRAALVDVGLIK